MKKVITLLCAAALGSSAYAFTYFQKGKAPSELLQKGDRYQHKNIYSTKDNLNGYSTFQDPYNANSVRNNPEKYGHQVQTYNKQKQGVIAPQVNSSKSITNPYGTHGNIYNENHPSNPYKPQKWSNPYSNVQNPYHSKSFRNDHKYGLQLKDSNGKVLGANHPHAKPSNSIPNIYTHSPFEAGNVQNPYGKNKRFN
jgi:hypothetical protein